MRFLKTSGRAGIILIVTAIVTGVIVPYVTSGWQDHQRELDLKTSLVRSISESAAQMVAAIQVDQYARPLDASANVPAYTRAYEAWLVASESLQSQLAAYFPRTQGKDVAADWNTYTGLVNGLFNLSDCSDPPFARSFNIKQLQISMRRFGPIEQRELQDASLLTMASPAGKHHWSGWFWLKPCKQLTPEVKGKPRERSWWALRTAILKGKNAITSEVLDTNMPEYTHVGIPQLLRDLFTGGSS